jgi:hypothetical protein
MSAVVGTGAPPEVANRINTSPSQSGVQPKEQILAFLASVPQATMAEIDAASPGTSITLDMTLVLDVLVPSGHVEAVEGGYRITAAGRAAI